MTARFDEHGQPVGAAVPDWTPPPAPARRVFEGESCRLEPLDPGVHGPALYEALAEETDARGWTYLPYGPFADRDEFLAWMDATCRGDDPLFFAIHDHRTGTWSGFTSYLRIAAAFGSIEVGHVRYAARMQRSRAGTEAQYLLMKHAFELGYRRYEWKADALNAPSRRAAERYGFRFEGVFLNSLVYKGRNRDTAWYSITDAEWPRLRERFEAWLAPSNFDAEGRQLRPFESVLESDAVSFRQARESDLAALVEMLADDELGQQREKPGPPLDTRYLEAFAETSIDPRNELWLCVDGAELLGMLQLTFQPSISHLGMERAQIENVRVASSGRGRGTGGRMIEFAVDRARERGCGVIQLTTDARRVDAHRFYEGLGFQATHKGMKLAL